MRASVSTAGGTIEFELSSGVCHSTGEFAGNVDATIRVLSGAGAKRELIRGLALTVPGAAHPLTLHGTGNGETEFEATFAGGGYTLFTPGNAAAAEVVWGTERRPLGTLALSPAPAEPQTLPTATAPAKAGCGAPAGMLLVAVAVALAALSGATWART